MSEQLDQQTEEQSTDYLSMSDEEFLNASLPDSSVLESDPNEDVDTPEPDDTPDTEESSEEQVEETNDAEDDVEDSVDGGTTDEGTKDSTTTKESSNESAELNYEEEYKKLLAPFKANGREIAVKNVDEAVTLMQMGANYNKKMTALKPNLRLLKMLENNGLLNEEKISFLIDLDKKDPNAISKLVSDSGIEPYELDSDKAKDYKQKNYSVDDASLAIDEIIGELEHSPHFARTSNIVSKEWDDESRSVLAKEPQVLRILNDHVERGIFDVIADEMERQRAFGKLTGLSDIAAYRQVGDQIQARGGFNHLNVQQGKSSSPAKKAITPPRKPSEDKLKEKRKAASPSTQTNPGKALPQDFNPLAMSDEEFEKFSKKYA